MKLFVSIVTFLSLTSIASADIPPPNSGQCGGKKNGDACTLDEGGPGHCVETTCSRARPDGTSSYPCTLCEPGAPKSTEPTPAPGTGSAPKKSSCTAGGADTLLALVAAAALLRRRR